MILNLTKQILAQAKENDGYLDSMNAISLTISIFENLSIPAPEISNQ
jgi:hypothetical protein